MRVSLKTKQNKHQQMLLLLPKLLVLEEKLFPTLHHPWTLINSYAGEWLKHCAPPPHIQEVYSWRYIDPFVSVLFEIKTFYNEGQCISYLCD